MMFFNAGIYSREVFLFLATFIFCLDVYMENCIFWYLSMSSTTYLGLPSDVGGDLLWKV